MADVWRDAGSVQVVNVRNDGALPGLPDDVDALVRAFKDYELLTIEAARSGDQQLAQLALITNPLGPAANDMPHVWERLRHDNEGLLGALDG